MILLYIFKPLFHKFLHFINLHWLSNNTVFQEPREISPSKILLLISCWNQLNENILETKVPTVA